MTGLIVTLYIIMTVIDINNQVMGAEISVVCYIRVTDFRIVADLTASTAGEICESGTVVTCIIRLNVQVGATL